jgi:hypothetical protein
MVYRKFLAAKKYRTRRALTSTREVSARPDTAGDLEARHEHVLQNIASLNSASAVPLDASATSFHVGAEVAPYSDSDIYSLLR